MLTSSNNFQVESSFTVESEKELISSFRFKDQKKLILPQGLKFPMHIRSYFTWKESSGVYTYLLYKHPTWDMPRGIAFKRLSSGAENPTGRICGWCNCYGSSEDIGMMSVTVNSTKSFAYILCKDLSCVEKIEEAAALSGKSSEKYIHQLYNRMNLFFQDISSYRPDNEM